VIAGNSTITEFGISNNGNTPLWANFTIPTVPFGFISLSADSVYMLPGQSLQVQILLASKPNAVPNIYIMPINMSVTTAGGKPTRGQFYTGLRISPAQQTSPVYLRSSIFSTASNQVITQYSIYNPLNKSVYNTRIATQLPITITNQISSIVLSGTNYNISVLNNQYILTWNIPLLQPRATSIVAFAVSNVSTPQYFYNPITSITTLSASNGTRFRIFNIQVPTFYVAQKNNITVDAMYTGTNESNVSVSLVPPAGVVVENQLQRFKVFPNTVVNAKFNVQAIQESGTYLFSLLVTGPFVNQSFSIPVIVLQNQTISVPPPSNSISAVATVQFYERWIAYVIIGVIALILILTGYYAYKRTTLSGYNKERSEELMRMKHRVTRELEEGEPPKQE
jgi:hypothetical protein